MLLALPPTLLLQGYVDGDGCQAPVGCVVQKGGQVVIVAWDIMAACVHFAEWWSLTPVDPVVVVVYGRRMCPRDEGELGEEALKNKGKRKNNSKMVKEMNEKRTSEGHERRTKMKEKTDMRMKRTLL
jgi:hypothetical protein